MYPYSNSSNPLDNAGNMNSGIAAKKGYNLDGILRANAIRPYTLVHFAAIPGIIQVAIERAWICTKLSTFTYIVYKARKRFHQNQ
jgi:hypothetical protein